MSGGRNWAKRMLAPKLVLPVSGAAGSNPIDLAHLRRYTLGDRSLEREVLDLFLAQLPVTIAALRQAGSDRDWKMAAHTLKGSGRAVGAWPLASVAEEAEQLSGVADGALCSAQVERIEQAAAEVRRFIDVAYQHG